MDKKDDILFKIDMQLYDEFNDTIATMNDHIGDIYSLRDVEEMEQAEKEKERKLLREAIIKLQNEVEFQKGQRKFWRDEYYHKMEQIQEIIEKSFNDIDYFNRDIRKDLEDLLKGE